jgi:MOSC domain-containing protein YiiM
MRLESVNAGKARLRTDGRGETGIYKEPVTSAVEIGYEGVAGDSVCDSRYHGGPDQAVYVYGGSDYDWWAGRLGHALDPGTFGENLTTEGLDLSHAVLGERWRVGTAVLEVAQPREPCFKLGIRMGAAAFRDRFAAADRPGAYLRIVEDGAVGAGDTVEVIDRPDHGRTILDLLHTTGDPTPDALRSMLAVPTLPEGWRDWAERHLAG